jgi:hypothetical protein
MRILEDALQAVLLVLVFVMSSQWGFPFPPVGKPFLFVSLGDIVLGVAFLVWLALVVAKRDWARIRLPSASLIAFASLILFSCAFAHSKRDAVKEAIQSLELFVAAGFLFLNGFRTPERWRRAVLVFAASVACILLLSLGQYFNAGNAFDINGTFGNKNILAAFLVLSLPFLVGYSLNEPRRPLAWGLLILLIPGLLVTLSGGALIALAVSTILVAALHGRRSLVVACALWALLFAFAPRLYLRPGHGHILHASIAGFLPGNYTYSPAAANQQAQRVFNEAGYSASRDFLAVYEALYRGHPDLKDSPFLTVDDVSNWEKFCVKLFENKELDGPSRTLWGRLPPGVQTDIQRAVQKLKDSPEASFDLRKGSKSQIVGILNAAIGEPQLFEEQDIKELSLGEEARNLAGGSEKAATANSTAMRNRRLLAACYPKAIALPIRMRLKKAVDDANADTERKLKQVKEQLDSLEVLKKSDPNDAEALLQEIADEHRTGIEERLLTFQLTEPPDPVPNTRYIRWHAAWHLIRSNRAAGLIGVGPGNFLQGVNRSYESGGPLRKPSAEGRGGAPDTWGISANEPDSFNQYLVYAAELGFLGLFAFLWVMTDGLWRAGLALRAENATVRGLALGAVGALAGVLVVSVFHPVVVRGIGLPLIFVLCAAAFAYGTEFAGTGGIGKPTRSGDPGPALSPKFAKDPETDAEIAATD